MGVLDALLDPVPKGHYIPLKGERDRMSLRRKRPAKGTGRGLRWCVRYPSRKADGA